MSGVQDARRSRTLEYQREVARQYDPYRQWILEVEDTEPWQEKGGCRMMWMEDCTGDWDLTQGEEPIVILISRTGKMPKHAISHIRTWMDANPDAAIAYADEDCVIPEDLPLGAWKSEILHQAGIDVEHMDPAVSGRVAPWFKPDFSPDTLLSFDYFGHIVAVRVSVLRNLNIQWGNEDWHHNLYDFYLQVSEQAPVLHIPEILFHRNGLPEQVVPAGASAEYTDLKMRALRRRGIWANLEEDEAGYTQVRYLPENWPLVSVIIPSKDHPELLQKCLTSLRDGTNYRKLEVMVIDNGSSEINQLRIRQLQKEFGFQYHVEPMEFNFSVMCNIGAKIASGDLLLLLNDDIEVNPEVTDRNWLKVMVGQALVPGVGAVGAKLLYPENRLIQHCGVSNITVGPVHRLHNYPDDHSYYYGRNRMSYNYLGVTAACLMVQKSIYEEAGGFEESMRVAYNDVDFCFTLYEKGYRQVVRNDVVLLHHESISRGRDLEGEKKARLDSERAALYERHPDRSPEVLLTQPHGIDPYCRNTELWKRNSLYVCSYLYDYEKEDHLLQPEEIRKPDLFHFVTTPHDKIWNRSRVMLSVDDFRTENGVTRIEGWALVTGQDNSLFRSFLLFRHEEGFVYRCPVFPMLREDVAELIKGPTNTLLSGFVVRFREGSLPAGKYRIGAYLYEKEGTKRYAGFGTEEWEILPPGKA